MGCYEAKQKIKVKKTINVIWLDANYDNEENSLYRKELESNGKLKINCFKETDEAIDYTKKIKFEETFIIISGRLYAQYITKFKEYINEINTIPKIIVFTKNVADFNNIVENKNLIDNKFYGLGGVRTNFKYIQKFILKPLKKTKISNENNNDILLFNDNKDVSLKIINKRLLNIEDKDNLTFEYIDCKEKIYFPLLYKSLIDTINTDQLDSYTESLYNKYKDNSTINKLLYPIIYILNIPIELLSKYYARLYTVESMFYIDMNKDLRENKKDNYLSYIKVLYEGIKTKSFSLASNNILYRGTRLLIKGIEKIIFILLKNIY